MSAPGTGKSRLADYGLEALKSVDPTKYPKLASFANNGASLAIHVTYNSATPFDEYDEIVGPRVSLACRLLSSYFRRKSVSDVVMLTGLRVIPNIKSLTLDASINVILAHHRRRPCLLSNQDLLLYIAIDDVTSILSHRKDGWTQEMGKNFLKALFDSLARHYHGRKTYFLAAIVTGTVLGPTSNILKQTFRRYVNLAVPLLTLQQSVQLAQDAFSRASVSEDVMDRFEGGG